MKVRSVYSKTPLRITLAGGGTDVLWYSRLYGGAWVSAAIDKYVNVYISDSSKTSNKINSTHPIISQCLKLANTKRNLEIKSSSDVPPGSGLGGSGAFEVGILNALYRFQEKLVTQEQLAQKATYIEIRKLKKPVGPQDQYITALGGIKYFEIDKTGRVTYESLKIKPETVSLLEENLLFFSTNIQRDAATVLNDAKKGLLDNIKSNKIISALNEIKSLGLLAKKFLILGQLDDFGSTLHQHWLIKKRLSGKISSPKVDEWYNEALKAGAIGGKMMGAGGGGWLVFYVNKNKNRFREKMVKTGLKEQKVKFDWKGTRAIARNRNYHD